VNSISASRQPMAMVNIGNANDIFVTVQRGDTMSSIAAKHNVPLQTVIKANQHIPNPNNIRIGDLITIPYVNDTATESDILCSSAATTSIHTEQVQNKQENFDNHRIAFNLGDLLSPFAPIHSALQKLLQSSTKQASTKQAPVQQPQDQSAISVASPSTPFPYSEQITQDVATGLPLQFGLAQEMRVDPDKKTETAIPANVVIGFLGTKAPLIHTSIEGVIKGMPALREAAGQDSSAVGVFQFLGGTATRNTAHSVFGSKVNLRTIPFDELTQRAMFKQRFYEALNWRSRSKTVDFDMSAEWESLKKATGNPNDYIRNSIKDKNGLFSKISAETAMDFIPYMESMLEIKNADGTLKPPFNPLADEVIATYGTVMGSLGQSLEEGITPLEKKFLALKEDARPIKEVVDQFFADAPNYNNAKGKHVSSLTQTKAHVTSMIEQVQQALPDVSAAQALHLINNQYRELGYVEKAKHRIPFINSEVKEALKVDDIISQARNYMLPTRQLAQKQQEINIKAEYVSGMMTEYTRLRHSTFERLSLIMNNDPDTHEEKFWEEYDADVLKREELARKLLGLHESLANSLSK